MQHTLSTLRVERDYYTTKQVAEIYHVTPQTIGNWIRKGWLQASRHSQGKGSRWRIHPQAIEDVETHREQLIELSKRYWVRLRAKMR